MKSRVRRGLLLVAAVLTLTLGTGVGTAAADDHLFNGATSNGSAQRGFANPVAGNPSGTSGAAAQPGTVPGLGDPKAGEDQGTPSFSCEALQERLQRSEGVGPPCE